MKQLNFFASLLLAICFPFAATASEIDQTPATVVEKGMFSDGTRNYKTFTVESSSNGVPKNWDITKSHAWNIDGYKIYERTKTVQTNHNGISTTKETTKETKEMVHCDFGWGGNCNGYYISGLFKSNDENTEIDAGSDNTTNTKYVKYLHLLTY